MVRLIKIRCENFNGNCGKIAVGSYFVPIEVKKVKKERFTYKGVYCNEADTMGFTNGVFICKCCKDKFNVCEEHLVSNCQECNN